MLYQDGTYNLAFVVKDASTNTVIKPLSAQYFGSFSLEGNNMYTRDFLKILNGDEVETANNSVWITASTARGFYWKINGNNGSISIGPHMATTNVYTECSGSFTRYLAGKSRAIADMLRQQKSAAVFKYGYKAFGR